MRLVQLKTQGNERKVALVENENLNILNGKYPSIYDLVNEGIDSKQDLASLIQQSVSGEHLDYEIIYNGESDWRLLPSFDHPENPSLCILSGTGLTHKASAENRQKMHEGEDGNSELTDSMKIYLSGEKEGKPLPGKIGVQPEWFYKGNGHLLKGHLEELSVPSYADDGGEEPEIAGVYIIDKQCNPVRVGFTMANEFSDHVMEKKNYLYLAPSKIRNCAIGPELVLDREFKNIEGKVSISRDNKEIWSKAIKTGEDNITHSLENLEYHHFKYDQHRLPGQVHIHFFGADAFSFGEKILLKDNDEMRISFDGFGKPLKNRVRITNEKESLVKVRTIFN